MHAFLVGIAGLCMGSFLNVLIDRLPKGEDVVYGRSHCDHCKKILRWYELIPLLSFAFQRGRCARCHKRLSWQYPLMEVATAVLYTLIYMAALPMADARGVIEFVGALVVSSAFLVIFMVDVKTYFIPDSMLVVGLVGYLPRFISLSPADKLMHLEVGVLSGLFFYLLYRITRRRGMGFGDVKLAGIIGLMLAYPGVIIALYVAFLTGAMYGVILMILRLAGMRSRVAFGPFLIFGIAVTLLWGQMILGWWGHLF